MSFRLVRTLRTFTSERFLLQSEAHKDLAVLDVHYLSDGSVNGTLVVLDDSLLADGARDSVLQFIDESLVPMASLNDKNLMFCVVQGKIVGQFENEK